MRGMHCKDCGRWFDFVSFLMATTKLCDDCRAKREML